MSNDATDNDFDRPSATGSFCIATQAKSIRNRRATQPPTRFKGNPPGRGQLAVFLRCSLLRYQSRYARRSRLEKQPTDLRRHHYYLRNGALPAKRGERKKTSLKGASKKDGRVDVRKAA
jgi:hypothetical protein